MGILDFVISFLSALVLWSGNLRIYLEVFLIDFDFGLSDSKSNFHPGLWFFNVFSLLSLLLVFFSIAVGLAFDLDNSTDSRSKLKPDEIGFFIRRSLNGVFLGLWRWRWCSGDWSVWVWCINRREIWRDGDWVYSWCKRIEGEVVTCFSCFCCSLYSRPCSYVFFQFFFLLVFTFSSLLLIIFILEHVKIRVYVCFLVISSWMVALSWC